MRMGLQKDQLEARQCYRNLWHTDLMKAPLADPPFCCFACWCGPCVSYMLRKRALYNDMTSYVCCGGSMPCSGRIGESKCPEFCLFAEVWFCFGNSVASTRFMLQDEFHIQTTKCDNCIIGFMLCLQQLACLFSVLACITGIDEIKEIAHLLSCLAELTYWTVCPCMQTQHKIEMDKRDGKFGPQEMVVPPVQQMSRINYPILPVPGYPQTTASGPSPGSYYPPATNPASYPPASNLASYPPATNPDSYPSASNLASYPPTTNPDSYPPASNPASYPPSTYDQPPPPYYPQPSIGYPHLDSKH